MKIPYSKLILVVPVLIAGCASHERATGLEQVSESQKNIEVTDKKITQAQEELNHFQNTVKDLRENLSDKSRNQTRAEASETLGRLAMRIEQSQLDLREIKSENEIAARDLDNRLKAAAQQSNKIQEQGTTTETK